MAKRNTAAVFWLVWTEQDETEYRSAFASADDALAQGAHDVCDHPERTPLRVEDDSGTEIHSQADLNAAAAQRTTDITARDSQLQSLLNLPDGEAGAVAGG